MSDFFKIFKLGSLFLILCGCASFKKQFCDCAKDPQALAGSAHAGKAEKAADKTPNKEAAGPIVVDGSDVELTDRMSKAVDAYVFKGEKDEFTNLCSDKRFDCFVNEKRFPKGRKKAKRKVPPFMSGSKMGLLNNERVRVKYEFFP